MILLCVIVFLVLGMLALLPLAIVFSKNLPRRYR